MDAHADQPYRLDTSLVVDVRDRSGRRLLAIAEPVDATPAAEALAHRVLAALRHSFLFDERAPLAAALGDAFAAANHEVFAENARPDCHDRRVLIGATAVAIDGSELLVALAPPGQAIVLQDGHLFAFPDLASWHPDYRPDRDESATPLGLSDSAQPALYSTRVAPGDAVLIGSTAVGRCLSASPHLAELAVNPSWLPATVKRVASSRPTCAAWLTIVPEEAHDPVLSEEKWLSPSLRRAIFFDRLRTRLIDTFERRIPATPDPNGVTGPLGAGYVHRYRSSHLPRGPRLPFRGRAIVAFLVLLLTLGGLYAGYDERQARAGQIDSLLAKTDADLAAITFDQRPAAIESRLDEAESSLAVAARNGADDSLLDPRRAVITAARDRLHNVTRLTDVTRLGTLPAAVDRSSLHLLDDGDRLYLMADAVYRVDDHTLTRLLAPGQTVSGRKVGAPLIAALDGDVLMVSDGRALYRLPPGGDWRASKLGSAGSAEAIACAAFDGSFYLIDAMGEILKYPEDDLGSPPEAWLGDQPVPGALDMVVDGSISVLGAGGEITTYFRGSARASFKPEVDPPVTGPVILAGGPDTQSLYLVDANGSEGRILRFDRDGRYVRQLLLPLAWQEGWIAGVADELAHVADLAVNETTGTVYFVGRDGIWRASIPG
jgi:hypothetical protein